MAKPASRSWRVDEALQSYECLNRVLVDMEEAEVLAALELEAATRRRRSFLDRLLARAVRIKETEYRKVLESKYLR